MILAIVGSTSLRGSFEAETMIEWALNHYQPTLVVSGGAKGIDQMAAQAAEKRNILVKEFLPKYPRWEPQGYKERNMQIACFCDALVRIVADDSKTYGSGWTRDYAKHLGKPTQEFIIRRPRPLEVP